MISAMIYAIGSMSITHTSIWMRELRYIIERSSIIMLSTSEHEGATMKYRVLKLRSGEEIITRITGNQKGKMTLERPMIFRTMMVHDGFGRPKEVTVLRNWTPNTNEIHTKIPLDYIATFLTPSEEAVKLYELEKDQEDMIDSRVTASLPPELPKTGGPESVMSMLEALMRLKEDMEDLEDEREEMLDSLEPSDSELDEIEESDDEEKNMMDMITMTMFFPPELLSKMINNGLIDPKQIGQILNELQNNEDKFSNLSDLYTGDQDREDLGSKWTDWSSNPEDYLKDDNP